MGFRIAEWETFSFPRSAWECIPYTTAGSTRSDLFTLDELMNNRKSSVFVIPAKAGIQASQSLMDSRSRIRSRTGLAGVTALGTSYGSIKIEGVKTKRQGP